MELHVRPKVLLLLGFKGTDDVSFTFDCIML